jgi:hypothetical protein
MAMTPVAILAALALADPASASPACGAATGGIPGLSYQTCATSPSLRTITAKQLFKSGSYAGTLTYQSGVQTAGTIVWGPTRTIAVHLGTTASTVSLPCSTGRKVQAAVRVKYHSAWEPVALSNIVTCA